MGETGYIPPPEVKEQVVKKSEPAPPKPSSIPQGVVNLTPDNFDEIVDGSRHVLVKFFAPWCGHCKTMAPQYEIAAESLKGKKDVIIAEVDADKYKELGSRFGVSGFPTLKFFKKGSKTPEAYEAGRDAQDVLDFIQQKTGIIAKLKQKPSFVKVLDVTNFRIITNQKKFVLVEFYARN